MARIVGLIVLALASIAQSSEGGTEMSGAAKVELGAFSVSLAVKDLEASQAFYAKLGFEKIGGDASQKWLILRGGDAVIGLFQGMFQHNILTFNPGWSGRADAEHPETFMDVREIQKLLKERGIELTTEADAEQTGPASLTFQDPDGNMILVDQHR